jgi:hypothetical protein
MKLTDCEQELERRQEALRGLYARYREVGSKLWRYNAVGFANGRYYRQPYGGHIHAALLLMKLQRNITDMAMLLLELQHSIDMERKKENENGRVVACDQETSTTD